MTKNEIPIVFTVDLRSNVSKFVLMHNFSFLLQENGGPNMSLKTGLAVSAYPCSISVAKNIYK